MKISLITTFLLSIFFAYSQSTIIKDSVITACSVGKDGNLVFRYSCMISTKNGKSTYSYGLSGTFQNEEYKYTSEYGGIFIMNHEEKMYLISDLRHCLEVLTEANTQVAAFTIKNSRYEIFLMPTAAILRDLDGKKVRLTTSDVQKLIDWLISFEYNP